ncbi:agmatinase [Odoribacter laneus]|jgi:agmatinase|uniref:Agmatinase n=1 Tax=Odoribacter laneus YIT 12061 TaxID=742817 RepID=H1DKL3_9BACT|nr:agmatinase [Odoribacter laneus]EHP45506.1 agmatinase [Odoribacter laneus YIT 12061]MBS1446237.1 agmatinase [Odoribacter sp.]GKI23316.1 agmatinase [Odoribacter laneus]GKI25416.1 agmatinase [Odoribacter laneus]
MEKLNYGGLDNEFTAYENARIVILPVPYDGTSTWLKGADKGPQAILEASANMELYDIETDSEVYTQGIATLEAVTEDQSPEAMSDAVEKQVDAILMDKKFPVLLGGEHSVSIGSIRAFAKHYENFSVLQLDAHSDMRDNYEGSDHNHACVMARAKEMATVAQVGIRSSCIEEKHNIDPDRIFYAHEIKESPTWMYNVSEKLNDNVYITIDLDVFDPAYMPSTGTPEPDGLTYREVINFLKLINERHNIIGLDIVELCPNEMNKAPDFLASKLIYQLLSMKFNHA